MATNTMPIAVSARTRARWPMKATATPANEAWASASPMNARPLSTTNAPMTAHTAPTSTLASTARRMKSNASGASSQPSALVIGSGIQGIQLALHAHQHHPRVVGLVEHALGEHRLRGALGDDPPVEAHYVIEPLGDECQVVRGHQDRRAPGGHLGEHGHHRLLRQRIDPAHRLV